LQRAIAASYLFSPPAVDAPTSWLARVNQFTIELLRGVAATTIAVLVLRQVRTSRSGSNGSPPGTSSGPSSARTLPFG
jgi:hypothetical protein